MDKLTNRPLFIHNRLHIGTIVLLALNERLAKLATAPVEMSGIEPELLAPAIAGLCTSLAIHPHKAGPPMLDCWVGSRRSDRREADGPANTAASSNGYQRGGAQPILDGAAVLTNI